MINHQWIKSEAEQLGCPVTDLLALARQNDPFYVGTPSSRTQAQWFANVWKAGGFSGGVHLRRLHYWCVSQGNLTLDNDKPYENTDRCWQHLCLASKAARYLGLVPIADIADHKNPQPHVLVRPQSEPNARFEIDTPDFADPYIFINGGEGYNLANVQPYLLEVWVEKSTMNDVLLPVCEQFRANLVTGEGEMISLTQRELLSDFPGSHHEVIANCFLSPHPDRCTRDLVQSPLNEITHLVFPGLRAGSLHRTAPENIESLRSWALYRARQLLPGRTVKRVEFRCYQDIFQNVSGRLMMERKPDGAFVIPLAPRS